MWRFSKVAPFLRFHGVSKVVAFIFCLFKIKFKKSCGVRTFELNGVYINGVKRNWAKWGEGRGVNVDFVAFSIFMKQLDVKIKLYGFRT